jgi:hypothetical protein
MAKNPKGRTAPKVSLSSLAKTLTLMRSEIRVNNQELQAGLTQMREEMRIGFEQLYRHIDGFVGVCP